MTAAPVPRPQRRDGMPARVLVADDQTDIVTALRLLLRNEGLDADGAGSASEVRARLHAHDYDLLLMDLNYARDTTSGREGLDLLTEVHARDRQLPIIVMTGCGGIDTAVEAMRRGARGFVHKPWENAALAQAVRREIEEGRAVRRADAAAAREQRDAEAMQRRLLPAALPSLPGCEIAARWQPASAFGGDCYDAMPLGDTAIAFSIADVCGKGLSAALVMSTLQASVRAFASADPSPARIAANVNQALCRTGLGRFVTFVFATYDAATRVLTYTNAGHNPPVLLRADGSVARLSTGGMLLGVFEETAFEQEQVQLRPGDRLVLFTDGITEAEDVGGQEFGDERLVKTVSRHRSRPSDVVAGLFDEVSRFSGQPLRDDATALAFAVD